MLEAVGIVNLVLCIIIVAMGIWGYKRTKTLPPLYVGIAFGLIAIYHLSALLGITKSIGILLIILNFIAYVLVIYSLYRPNLDDLQKLASLKSKGIITEEEYVTKKKQILGS
jgi:uncharacterized membrane protein (UPF0136 family)